MHHLTRENVDIALALLAAMVALYHRAPLAKRQEFERRYPRIAALIGIVAAIVPFLPMLAENARKLLTPNAHPGDTPQAPWSEAPSDTAVESESGNGEQNP